MGENVGKLNKLKMIGRKRRLVIATIGILAVGLGAWAIWHHLTKPEEITLDLGNNVKMRLVLIPAGKFMMGSPANEKDRFNGEGPQHEVIISNPFYMGVYEVTQEQYEQMMGANPSYFKGATNPVETVFWDDAVEFCAKLSDKTGTKVTLPTEAQWEYACRAGTTTRFNTGDQLRRGDANAHFRSNPGIMEECTDWLRKHLHLKSKAVGTTPVGSFPPNAWGLYDMHGNVCEWCSDWYGVDYYANSSKIDPRGPNTGERRILRGGAFVEYLDTWYCRSASRCADTPDGWGTEIGFRVVVLPGSD